MLMKSGHRHGRKSGGSSTLLRCMILHARSSILKTMCTAMVLVAIISFALTCIEFHTQSSTLVVVEAPSAPILVLCEGGTCGLSFAGALLSTLSFSFSLRITRWRERFRYLGSWLYYSAEMSDPTTVISWMDSSTFQPFAWSWEKYPSYLFVGRNEF